MFLTFERLTVDRVVLEQVDQVIQIHEWIVDCHNSGFTSVLSERCSEGESSDSSESVDTESD